MGNCCKKQTLVIAPEPITSLNFLETQEKQLDSQPKNSINEIRKSPENFKKPIFKREGTTSSLMDIRNVYKFEPKVIGNGYFGTVRAAFLIINPTKKFAIKTIYKEKIQKSLHLLKRELEILKTLDHPNIIKFYETYQDDKFFHFVMEYCSGGELLDKIANYGFLPEKEAANIMKKIFSAVNYLHERGIVHRDLKPENFLFSHKGKDAEIKIIDFGLSKQFERQNNAVNLMQTMVGTAFYVAPEVLQGSYDFRCDNWSLGVITYILLSGHPPFYAESQKEVFDLVKRGKFSFKGTLWKKVSKQAKDFISRLLVVDLNKRMNAKEALEHIWLNMNIKENNSPIKISPQILKSIKHFLNAGQLKKEVMKFIVNLMSENELKQLKETFQAIDKQNKGKITLKELKKALEDLGYKSYLYDLKSLMTENDDYEVTYSEFIAANLEQMNYFQKDKLYKVFKHFDIDNTESINVRNLKESMAREGRKLSNEELELWIKEADKKSCGKIGFLEFMEMMKVNESNDSVILETSPVGKKALITEEEDFFHANDKDKGKNI